MNPDKVNRLLEDYWKGNTSLEEEKFLRTYFLSEEVSQEHQQYRSLFVYFKNESEIGYQGRELNTHTSKLHRLKRNWMGLAAAIILLTGFGFVVFNYLDKPAVTEDHWAQYEIKDPEKAKAMALDALAFMSVKLQKGEENVKQNFKVLNKMPLK